MFKKIVVTSVSASGKTTMCNKAIEFFNLKKLKTCTTRLVRDEEKGDEYYFIDNNLFDMHIENDDLIEYSSVYGKYYGLLKDEVTKYESNVIVVLDVQGANKFKAVYPDAVSIFLEPPTVKEMIIRMRDRNMNPNDILDRVLERENEIGNSKYYDYVIPTGDLDTTWNTFKTIITQILET